MTRATGGTRGARSQEASLPCMPDGARQTRGRTAIVRSAHMETSPTQTPTPTPNPDPNLDYTQTLHTVLHHSPHRRDKFADREAAVRIAQLRVLKDEMGMSGLFGA